MIDVYKNWKLHDLLEAIQGNLAFDIDSYYNKAKELIGTDITHNLGFLKEQLKGNIETYLKGILQNVINFIEKSYNTYNPFIQPHINLVKRYITNHIEEAIGVSWIIRGNCNSKECPYHANLNGNVDSRKCHHLNNQPFICSKITCPIKV